MPFGGLLTVGLIGAGTDILGGIFGGNAASRAARQQRAGIQAGITAGTNQTNNANTTLADWYNRQSSTLQPYMDLGLAGGFQLRNLGAFTPPNPADVANTPEYKFLQQQGTKGVTEAAAAGGGALSGGTLKSLSEFNQGLASTEYQKAYENAANTYGINLNRIFGETSLGQRSASQLAGIGAEFGSQSSSNAMNLADFLERAYTGMGNAQAAGTVGGANAWGNAFSGIGNMAQLLTAYGIGGGAPQFGPLGTPSANPGISTGDLFSPNGPGYGLPLNPAPA